MSKVPNPFHGPTSRYHGSMARPPTTLGLVAIPIYVHVAVVLVLHSHLAHSFGPQCPQGSFKSSVNASLCANLTKQPAVTSMADCANTCCQDPLCGVWEWCPDLPARGSQPGCQKWQGTRYVPTAGSCAFATRQLVFDAHEAAFRLCFACLPLTLVARFPGATRARHQPSRALLPVTGSGRPKTGSPPLRPHRLHPHRRTRHIPGRRPLRRNRRHASKGSLGSWGHPTPARTRRRWGWATRGWS